MLYDSIRIYQGPKKYIIVSFFMKLKPGLKKCVILSMHEKFRIGKNLDDILIY